jgi:hypothetical protein
VGTLPPIEDADFDTTFISSRLFMTSQFFLLGLLSGLITVLAYLPYLRDTASGETRPQRASWLIWSVLASISLASQAHEGATHSLWFAGTQTLATCVVFLLSLWKGSGSVLTKSDIPVVCISAVGLVLWYFTDTATYALMISISISLIAGTVTVRKAYDDPESETFSTWFLSLVGALLAIGSISTFDPVLLAYPVYLVILKTAIVAAILKGRQRRSWAGQAVGYSG